MKIEIPEPTELELEFLYKLPVTGTQDQIVDAFRRYIIDNEKWVKKANFEASIRARNALLEIFKLARQRRQEILDERNMLE